MNGHNADVRNPKQLVFHPQSAEEYNIPRSHGEIARTLGVRPMYRDYSCGACGKATTGRLLCDVQRKDGDNILWCMCACDKKEPTIIVEKGGIPTMQLPQSKQFHADPAWPVDLAALFDEAAKSFSAGAYTSSSLVCRKLLMSCVCHEQERSSVEVKEGESFKYYVDYLSNNILSFPQARAAIDSLRAIGNDATHHVTMITQPEAERAMKVAWYLLTTLYSLPAA